MAKFMLALVWRIDHSFCLFSICLLLLFFMTYQHLAAHTYVSRMSFPTTLSACSPPNAASTQFYVGHRLVFFELLEQAILFIFKSSTVSSGSNFGVKLFSN